MVVREAVERAMAEAVTEPVERAASVGDWLISISSPNLLSDIGFFIYFLIFFFCFIDTDNRLLRLLLK